MITDPALAYVNIKMISRTGKVQTIVSGTPAVGTAEVQYQAGSGSLVFDQYNPFLGPSVPGRVNRNNLEKIIVIYKTDI